MKNLAIFGLAFFVLFLAATWQVKAQTTFGDDSGIYGKLLNDLKSTLSDKHVQTVTLDGKQRTMFVSWVRDHIHTMKAYKYWEKDMGSYLDFYMGRQTPKGMYFDYWESYKDHNVGQLFFTNCFDKEFYFVDVENQNFFFRMPIEADVEYLLVEGVYTYWQTSGDKAYLQKWIPTLVKGMKYEMTDPLRWSDKYLLVKRPYSIDTWDFTSQPDSLKGVDRLLGHIGNTLQTPKGIMHGDNSGMYQACRQLSMLFEATGQPAAAKEWDLQGDLFRQRLNTVCWNGKFYAHFIPEQPVPSHIKTDPINSIGLSNTYSINRGAPTREMTASIIKTYQEIGEKTKSESLAPWFGIYPPINPHFGNYPLGEYMNGAVLPLVGGELAKAAFQNGFEDYAVQQLKVMDQIMGKNNRNLPGCVNTDGTAQKEAIPDQWGQAAFVSALVEGLAGVVDKSILFKEVEISPRWYFTEIDKTSVTIGYGGDGSQVSYQYAFDRKNRQVNITTSGKFDRFTLRVPFPQKTATATALINGKEVQVTVDQVNQSRYAVVKGLGSNNQVEVRFR
ncbi:MAG: hypothetical protein ACM3PR_14155 [Bacteroidales bacterium]